MYNYRVQLPNGKHYDIVVRRAWMAGHGNLDYWLWQIRYCNEYLPVMRSGYAKNEAMGRAYAENAVVEMAQKMVKYKGDRVIMDYMDGYETLRNTQYGNPRYALYLEDAGRVITSSDCADAYGVTNHVEKVSLFTLTRAGRMRYVDTIKVITDNDKDA